MKPTQQLHDLGQSLWLDNITRALLTDGTLRRYITDFSVTGLTSNPTIFAKAIKEESSYDATIRQQRAEGKSAEAVFIELALADLVDAADLFRPAHDSSGGVDGWVSLEVSPLLADDTAETINAAVKLHRCAQRPNLFIKIPGTRAGIPAIEESIFRGVPINVTLLFSREQYIAAAEAYMRGITRRIAAGLDPNVSSVASLFVSRWDVAVQDRVPGSFAIVSESPSPSARIRLTADCWPCRAGQNSRLQALGRSGCSGPAPVPRIRMPRIRSTSKR